MSSFEIDTTRPAERQPPPRQFTLSGLLRLFVVVGVICATAVWFDAFSAAALAAVTLILYFPRWTALPRSRTGRFVLVGVAIGLIWGAMLLVPFLTGLAVLVPAALLLARTAFHYLALFIALTPLGVSFAEGVCDYCRGQAEMRTEGYYTWPPPLDPKTRCYWQSSGCVVHGHEWAIHEPYNGAVTAMTSLFGYMRGAYAGPYPTEAEAIAAARTGTRISWDDLVQGQVKLPSLTVRLDQDLLWLLRAQRENQTANGGIATDPLAVLWKGACVLIRLRGAREDSPYEPRPYYHAVVFVFTAKTGQALTTYAEREEIQDEVK